MLRTGGVLRYPEGLADGAAGVRAGQPQDRFAVERQGRGRLELLWFDFRTAGATRG